MDKEICDSKELAWTHGMHEWKSLIELLPERRNKTEKFSDSGQIGVSKNVNKVWSLLESNELEFAVDLVKSLNNPSLCSEILSSIRLVENNWYSNLKVPLSVEHEHGVILFLVCLEILINADQVPEYFHDMNSFVSRRYIPINYLYSLRFFSNLNELTLDVSEAKEEDLEFIKFFLKLEKLTLYKINQEVSLDFLLGLKELKNLEIVECKTTKLDSVFKLPKLVHLQINKSIGLKRIDHFLNSQNLTSVDLSECSELVNIDALGDVTSLREINLSECKKLADVSGLATLKNLNYLNIGWCDLLKGPIPSWILSVENLCLDGLEWHLKLIGKMLKDTSIFEMKVVWNGSGDDGYCERIAYNKAGIPLEDDLTNNILVSLENFVLSKLPGGAGNDAGSKGVMHIKVSEGKAVWDFHWNDGLDFFREKMNLWSDFQFLRFEFEFICFEEQESFKNLKENTDGDWQWCFDKEGPMGLSLKTVINHTKDVSQIIPTKHFSAMEDLFSEWLMDSYYDEVNDVLNKLCDGCKEELPDYLLQRELIVELNCLDKKVTFQINNNFETIDLQFEKQREIYDL